MSVVSLFVLGTVLGNVHGHPPESLEGVKASESAEPKQEKCTDLTALKSWEPNPAYQVTEWIVTRLTFMTDSESLDGDQNNCSVYSYTDGCGAIHHFTNTNKSLPTKQIVDTFAYSKITKNLAHQTETFTKEDEHYNVWKGQLDACNKIFNFVHSLTYIEVDPTKNEAKSISERLFELHKREFASVGVDKLGKWIIHRVCETDITWVSFPKKDLDAEHDPKAYIDRFKKDIDEHLASMKLNPETVKEIDIKLEIGRPQPPDGKN